MIPASGKIAVILGVGLIGAVPAGFALSSFTTGNMRADYRYGYDLPDNAATKANTAYREALKDRPAPAPAPAPQAVTARTPRGARPYDDPGYYDPDSGYADGDARYYDSYDRAYADARDRGGYDDYADGYYHDGEARSGRGDGADRGVADPRGYVEPESDPYADIGRRPRVERPRMKRYSVRTDRGTVRVTAGQARRDSAERDPEAAPSAPEPPDKPLSADRDDIAGIY